MSGSCFLTLRDNTVQNPRCSPQPGCASHTSFYANVSLRANPLRCLLELCMNNGCILSARFDSSSVVLLQGASCVQELIASWLYTIKFSSQNRNEEGKTWRTVLVPTVYFKTQSPVTFSCEILCLIVNKNKLSI